MLAHGWLPDQSFYCVDFELCEATLNNYIYDYYNSMRTVFPSDDLSAFDLPDESWKAFNNWSIIKQISNGLQFLHHCGQIHQNLKISNSTFLACHADSSYVCKEKQIVEDKRLRNGN